MHRLFLSLATWSLVLGLPLQARAWMTLAPAPPAAASWSHFEISSREPLDPSRFPLELVWVGPPPEGLTEEDVERALRHATRQWSQVPCSSVQVRWAGTRAQLEQVDPEQIPVMMRDPARPNSCLRGNTTSLLGAAPCPLGPALGISLNGADFSWTMLDALDHVPLDEQNRPTRIDLTSTVTHELGHVLGLSHPPLSDVPLATMYATYRSDGGQAKLAADDRAGLCTLYPAEGASGCVDAAGCRARLEDPGARCVERAGFAVCEKEQGQLGDYCASDLLHCPGTCLFSDPEARTGYCTEACSSDEGCPQEWTCDDSIGATISVTGLCRPAPAGAAEPACAHLGPAPSPLAPPAAPVGLMALLLLISRRSRRR